MTLRISTGTVCVFTSATITGTVAGGGACFSPEQAGTRSM